MAAISTRQPTIEITYATAKGRRSKKFSGEQLAEARQFYGKKLEVGADPQIHGDKPANWDAPADEETAELNAAVAEGQATKDTGPATLKVPGVSLGKTRSYEAGRIIAKFGHAAGCTAELVAALDAAYQKPNATESDISIRNSWHAIRGFCEELGIPVPTARHNAQRNA